LVSRLLAYGEKELRRPNQLFRHGRVIRLTGWQPIKEVLHSGHASDEAPV